jgi:acyl carrier protein
MNSASIYEQLTSIFRDVFEDDTLVPTPTMKADDVEEWDSLNHINLMVAIETRFKIKFKTAEIESLRDVGHLVEIIEKKVGQKPS